MEIQCQTPQHATLTFQNANIYLNISYRWHIKYFTGAMFHQKSFLQRVSGLLCFYSGGTFIILTNETREGVYRYNFYCRCQLFYFQLLSVHVKGRRIRITLDQLKLFIYNNIIVSIDLWEGKGDKLVFYRPQSQLTKTNQISTNIGFS